MAYLRYPILFETSADNDKTNGIGALSDVTKLEVIQTVNAIPTLTMEYKADGVLVKEIKTGRIIMTDASPILLRQKFRIQEVSKTLDGVSVQAVHIASDFTNRIITKSVSLPNLSASQCFQELQDAMPGLEQIPGVEFTSDIPTLANINYTVENNTDMSAILMGADQVGDEATQSMQTLYHGNWLFDNYHFSLLKNPGKYTGEVIKHGRDMGSITNEENITQMYTGIFPYAKYTPTPKKPLPTDMTQAGAPYDGQGTVQYLGSGNLTTYDTPYPGHSVVGTLVNGQKLKIVRKLDGSSDPLPMNGDDWYMLSDNTWVDATFITFDKSGDYIINTGNGQAHTTAGTENKGTIYVMTGTARVTIQTIHVYKSPFHGSNHKPTGVTFKLGDRLNYGHMAIAEDGIEWYEVGVDEWVYGPHLSFDKKGDIVYQPVKGKAWIKNNSTVYKSPGKIKYLNANGAISGSGSGLKPAKISGGYFNISGQATENDVLYYKIGTDTWVKASSCDFTKKKSVKPVSPSQYADDEARTDGKIELHDKPAGNSILYAIPANEEVHVIGTAESSGESWSQVETADGHVGWVLSDSLDYSADTDVPPDWGADSGSGDDSDEEIAAQEVFVTLPNTIIYADNCIGWDWQRIQPIDLSSYWQADDNNDSGQPTQADIDQLQQLAQSYMKEYRIGQPDPSTTLTESEVGKISSAGLYDTVGVQYDEMGIQVTAQVTSTTFDALGHQYISKTIGNLPIDYDHLLLQTANDNANSKFGVASSRIDANASLSIQIHEALKQEGADRLAAETNIAKQIGVITDDFNGLKGRVDEFDQDLVDINNQFNNVQQWIDSGGSAVLQFIDATGHQSYKNPVRIKAVGSNGEFMELNDHGLQFVDENGDLQSAVASNGTIAAQCIDAGKITALHAESFLLEGALHTSTKDGSMEVFIGTEAPDQIKPDEGGHAIWVKSDNYEAMLSSGRIEIENRNSSGGDTQLTPTQGFIGGATILTQHNYDAYIQDYLTNHNYLHRGASNSGKNAMVNWINEHWVGKANSWKW